MNRFGINVELKNTPVLDPDFMPLMRFNRAFLAGAKKPVGIAVERAGGQMASCRTFIHGTPEMAEADHYYIERIVKTILWMKGGFKVYVSGDEGVCKYLQSVYRAGGQQVPLANNLVQGLGADLIRQGALHGSPSFSFHETGL